MTVMRLNKTGNYMKFEVIKKAGFELVEEGKGWRLIDKCGSNIEKYVDTHFKSVNEALSVLSNYLSDVGYKVVAV